MSNNAVLVVLQFFGEEHPFSEGMFGEGRGAGSMFGGGMFVGRGPGGMYGGGMIGGGMRSRGGLGPSGGQP